ncbi:MAG: hypothetical protein JZD41_05450 [Thermoproteus sp.]|nr:hypothetical protein [Thermoproteus sp.]
MKPEKRVLVEPIVLNINVEKSRGELDDLDAELAVQEVERAIRDAEDYLKKLRMGLVLKNPEFIARLNKRLVKAARAAKMLGLSEEYAKLLKLKAQLVGLA